MGQRIGVIREGRVAQVGTPDELYDRPLDSFVAALVGSPKMNLLAAASAGDGRVVRLPFAEVAGGPWAAALQTFPVGTPVLFGFRPHDVRPAGEGDAGDPRFPARVHLTEPLGDVTVLDLEARGGAAFRMVLPEERAVAYREGDELEVELALPESQLFAMDTGTAIR
jgi:multiple sugar transport system ATP-binding protein